MHARSVANLLRGTVHVLSVPHFLIACPAFDLEFRTIDRTDAGHPRIGDCDPFLSGTPHPGLDVDLNLIVRATASRRYFDGIYHRTDATHSFCNSAGPLPASKLSTSPFYVTIPMLVSTSTPVDTLSGSRSSWSSVLSEMA